MVKKKYSYYRTLLKTCRQIWARSFPARRQALFLAKVKGNDNMDKWQCAHCLSFFALSEVQCDHKIPIENTIPTSLEEFEICNRKLHASIEQLQILCRSCHKVKTKSEIYERKKADLLKKIFGHVNAIGYDVAKNSKIHDMKTLKQLSNVIKNIETAKEDKKEVYIVKLQNLLEKYL